MIDSFASEVSRELAKFLRKVSAGDGRRVAVFDADGTLWRRDVGEAFFRHQVERKIIPHAPSENAWEVYRKESEEGSTVKAFGWLAQWNAGVCEEDLVRWCEEFFRDEWVKHVFEPMREFSHALLNAGFEVWVVTGSPRWIVQVGVRGFGVPADRVIGTSVIVKNGVLTEKLEHEVPYRAGKVRLIKNMIGEQPLFVAGNTYWDKEMMLLAKGLAIAIQSERKGEPNFDSEQKLQKLALTNRWLCQKF